MGAHDKHMKRSRSAGTIAADIVIVVLAICLIAAIAARFSGIQAFTVLSGSMEPSIPTGSLVVVKACDIDDVQEGDVVTFVMNEQLDLATHRVVSVDREEGTVTTRGDANNVDDGPTLWGNVVGRVILTVPNAGYALWWVNSTAGRIIAAAVLIAIILAIALVRTVRRPGQHGQPRAGDGS